VTVVVGSSIQRTNNHPIKSRCMSLSVSHMQERELAKVSKSRSNLGSSDGLK
jgi:hypothetical protein